MPRFSSVERSKGWHVHYDKVDVNSLEGILWAKEDLTEFKLHDEIIGIQTDAIDNSLCFTNTVLSGSLENLLHQIYLKYSHSDGVDLGHVKSMIDFSQKIIELKINGNLPTISISKCDFEILSFVLKATSNFYKIKAQPLHSLAINNITFNVI